MEDPCWPSLARVMMSTVSATNASTAAQMQEMRDMIMKLEGELAAKA